VQGFEVPRKAYDAQADGQSSEDDQAFLEAEEARKNAALQQQLSSM
jgi:hypothetical protein